MTRPLTLLLLLLSVATSLTAQVTVTDADLSGANDFVWSNDNDYLLDGLVFLESGATLTIEPGTVIRALDQSNISTGDNTSALIVARGARIVADGTADEPIIFTAEGDNIQDGADFTAVDRGLWGGIIILGYANIGNSTPEDAVEGIAATEVRARYGGDNDDDDSGILRYVSIRHGGAQLSQDNEINGLTLGAVGSGTVIDYVEVFANLDDGIEFFGGTVNVKHASVAFCGDDAFDYDQGWRGNGQFWFALQAPNTSTGRSGEHDGATPDNADPFSNPTIYNATYIGIGEDATATGGDASREGRQQSVIFRDNAAGKYYNSLFTGFNQRAIAIEDRDDTDTDDSYARFQAGDLVLKNNFFDGFGAGDDAEDIFNTVSAAEDILTGASNSNVQSTLADDNEIGDSGIANIGRAPGENLDPRIDADGAALSGGDFNDEDGDFFNIVSYRGAFGNSYNWLEDWTALSDNGYLGDEVVSTNNSDCIVVRDSDLSPGQTYNWGGGNCYTLDGLVFVEADATLNIEAGTVIRALEANDVTTGDNTSALIVARDGQIYARGTAAEPIIFTANGDDTDDPNDFTSIDRGLWGGVIILGRAPIANNSLEDAVEGISATEVRARYGGTEEDDNSGVLNYVSIRHGGAQLSQDNEINGLTLGGVGSGTEIDYVEVFANLDDGIEWFGGHVIVDHAAVSFCGDDAYDYDQGYQGGGQFWFSLQGPNTSTGRAGEHDGATPDSADPFSNPFIANATYIGIGNGQSATGGDANRDGRQQAVIFRDNAAGTYVNSIFADFNNQGIAIEDRDDEPQNDSYGRFLAGDLQLRNNIFFNFGAGDTPADLFAVVNPDEDVQAAQSAILVERLVAANNVISDPVFIDEDRDNDGFEFDPRPNQYAGAATGAEDLDRDGFDDVDYFGAFEPAEENGNSNYSWLSDWTALSTSNIVVNATTSNREAEAAGYLLAAPAPNPAANETTISFTLPRNADLRISVIDITGRTVASLQGRNYLAGENSELLDTSRLPNGTYFVALDAAGYRLVQKLVVSK